MSYAPGAETSEFVADPRRVLLGVIAAPLVPSLAALYPTFFIPNFPALAVLGLLSVITLYLPLVLWRLRRTRHPFLTCVMVGGLSAPGLLGYLASFVLLSAGGPLAVLEMILATFPLGAVGGATFWLCVVWRSDPSET